MPSSSARSAVTGSPVRTSSSAILGPTRKGRIVDASGGKMPMLISGWANRAFGVAITRSPKAASSAPPPIAGLSDSAGDFAEHGFIEKIMFRTIESYPRDAGVDAELDVLKLFRFAPFRLRCEILGVDRLNHFPRSWAFTALLT